MNLPFILKIHAGNKTPTQQLKQELSMITCLLYVGHCGEGNGNPLHGAWWAAVHGVAKSQTQLSDFTFIFHFHALEKEMATHSSVLA